MHVTLDQYLDTLRGVLPRELLLQQAHSHLLELCAECRKEWGGGFTFDAGSGCAPEAALASATPQSPMDARQVSLAQVREAQQHLSRMRAIARRAREDLARLRQEPHDRWPDIVREARTRFRSRAFAHLLLEESQAAVRTAPGEAAALATLIPVAISRISNRMRLPWAHAMRVRAAAHHANALRVGGDFRAADRVFTGLRARSKQSPIDPPIAAEVASLEASLRIAQRRFADADRLLAVACVAAEDGPFTHRVLIKHGNLLRAMGSPVRALERYEQAEKVIDAAAEPRLALIAAAGRINCLCDLDRYGEAAEILSGRRDELVEHGDAHTKAVYAFYRARVDLGLGELSAAERRFGEARDRFLDLDRDYDATQAALFLADALVASGKTAELKTLAAELVPLFRSRGVEREALASLRLLAQAVQAETVTASLLAELRQKLHSRSPSAVSASIDG